MDKVQGQNYIKKGDPEMESHSRHTKSGKDSILGGKKKILQDFQPTEWDKAQGLQLKLLSSFTEITNWEAKCCYLAWYDF